MKNVLVTGSEGAVGKFIIDALRKNNEYFVIRVAHGMVRAPGPEACHIGDLREYSFAKRLFSEYNIHHVIHCAARWNGYNNDFSIGYDNSLITLNLLKFCKDIYKFHYVSSSGVYVNPNNQMEDDDNYIPFNSYGMSKLFSENMIKFASNTNNFIYTIWRPFHIVSPFEKYKPGSSHICTDIYHKLVEQNKKININDYSDTYRIPMLWAGDVANCIVDNMNNEITRNEIFNLGPYEQHSVKDIVKEIITLTNDMSIIKNREKIISKNIDNRFIKIKNKLGLEWETNFYDCIRKFMECKLLDFKKK